MEATKQVVARYNLEKWFLRVPEGRDYARDLIEHLVRTRPASSHILELGCGIAQNLVVLEKSGFARLAGIEVNPQLFMAAMALCSFTASNAELVCGDAESVSFYGRWDVIMPLNWTYRAGVDIRGMLSNIYKSLRCGGEVIIDIIDSSLPADQSPEYVQRFSRGQVENMLNGMYRIKSVAEYHPRVVYYLEKRCTTGA